MSGGGGDGGGGEGRGSGGGEGVAAARVVVGRAAARAAARGWRCPPPSFAEAHSQRSRRRIHYEVHSLRGPFTARSIHCEAHSLRGPFTARPIHCETRFSRHALRGPCTVEAYALPRPMRRIAAETHSLPRPIHCRGPFNTKAHSMLSSRSRTARRVGRGLRRRGG